MRSDVSEPCAILPITSVIRDPDAVEPVAVDYLQQVRREDRLADKVADLLRKAILSGQLRPGDRLPPERVLGDRFGVSRTVVREAIRSLTANGLVEVRSGSGSVVARVGAGAVAETMQLYLQGATLQASAIDEVRAMLEVHVAGVAAERATEEDLQDMRDALSAMAAARDHERRAAHEAELHRCVARAARNPLYVLLLDSIGEAVDQEARPPAAVLAHERIVERIAAHDAEGAREAMRAHLAESRRAPEGLLALTVPEPTAEAEPAV
jgi:GntR family transcriptional regulator, transcriptional repressor for pyruvate dehydrogenase complex